MSLPRIPLEVLRVESPCHESWEAMAGDDGRRFCQGCQKHVHNLSALSRAEAERLICESAGSLCVRMERSPDGLVLTAEEMVPTADGLAGGLPAAAVSPIEYQRSLRKRRAHGWRFWTCVGAVGALASGVVQAFVGRSPVAALTPTPAPASRPAARTSVVLGMVCPPSAYPRSPATAPAGNTSGVVANPPQPARTTEGGSQPTDGASRPSDAGRNK